MEFRLSYRGELKGNGEVGDQRRLPEALQPDVRQHHQMVQVPPPGRADRATQGGGLEVNVGVGEEDVLTPRPQAPQVEGVVLPDPARGKFAHAHDAQARVLGRQ